MIMSLNGTHNDVEDTYQEGLLIFYNNLLTNSFRHKSSIKTYLYSICKNVWVSTYNARIKENQINFEEIHYLSNQEIEINTEALKIVFSKLDKNCKKILTQFYYEKKSMAEIKESFNLGSIQAAKNKKYRCLKSLSKLVNSMNLNFDTFLK